LSSKKQFDPDSDELEIRGRMEIEDIVKYQINRCNISATDPNPAIFNSNVLALLDNLPKHKRMEVLENKKAYGKNEETEEYEEFWCGEPVTASKKTVTKFVVDHHKLYRTVLDAYADSGLTWKIEPELKELGLLSTKKKIPTPHYTEEKTDEQTKA